MSTTNHNGVHRFDGPLVDKVQMGRLIRAARIVAGYDRVDDAAEAISEMTGTTMSSRTLYALERGEQTISLEQMIAVVMTFRPPGDIVFFEGGTRPDVQQMFGATRRES